MVTQRSRYGWVSLVILIAGLAGSAFAWLQTTDPSGLLKVADELVQQVASVRHLEPKAPIQKGVRTRSEISQFLNEHVRDNFEEDELRAEGKMLHKLGLIPPSTDYKEFTLKLLTEQVGGYYDPDKKTFFIAGWLPAEQQRPVMVHELTHALQDQYFDLNRLLKEERKLHNDDKILARQAIIEGDAMAAMIDYLAKPSGRNFAGLPDLAFIMRAQFSSMDSQYEIFKAAPLFLKETLLFPYGYGAAFLQKVWAKSPSWSAVDKLYSDLPSSSEQILHPDRYLVDRDDPKPVTADSPVNRLGTGWTTSYKNVLGEFSLSLLLQVHIPEEKARRAADGWGGDQVLLLENTGEKQDAVFDASVWDSPDEADEFYAAFKEWLNRRCPKGHVVKESENEFSLTQDGEFNLVARSGTGVTFMVGLPEKDSAKLK